MAKSIRNSESGRFVPQVVGRRKTAIIRALVSGVPHRRIAQDHDISVAEVSNIRKYALRNHSGTGLQTRKEALAEREKKVFDLVRNLGLKAKHQGRPISARSMKPFVDSALKEGISLDVINKALDSLAAQKIIPQRKKPGRVKKEPSGKPFDIIVSELRKNPAVSNQALMQLAGLTAPQLDLCLRRLREHGKLPQRNRPGGKPLVQPEKK